MIDHGEIIVEQLEHPNVDANHLPQDDTNEVNMIGAGSTRVDPNCKYIRKIEEYPQVSGANVIGWECLEEVKIIKQEVLMIRHQLKQLTDLVVHQQECTRQLFTQLERNQEKEGDEQSSDQKPSQKIQLTKEDQSQLKGQGMRNNKITRRSRQWSFDNRLDECEPSKGKEQATCPRERKFTPLNKSKAEILHLLISRGRITELLPPTDPKSKRYDHTQICLYHSNSPGHDTEECWALRHKIQNLIESGDQVMAITDNILKMAITSIKGNMTNDKWSDEPRPTKK